MTIAAGTACGSALTTTAALVAVPAFGLAQDTTAPNTDIPEVVLEQTTQQFIASLEGSTPINELPYDEARQVLIDAQTAGDTAMPDADVQEMTLNVGPTGEVKVYTVRPAGTDGETLPGVVYFHGGGWVLGNFTTHERLMRDLARRQTLQWSSSNTVRPPSKSIRFNWNRITLS